MLNVRVTLLCVRITCFTVCLNSVAQGLGVHVLAQHHHPVCGLSFV